MLSKESVIEKLKYANRPNWDAESVDDAIKSALNYFEEPMNKLKKELIKLVCDHKNRCDGSCNISVLNIRLIAEKAGMVFTEDEKGLFI